MVVRADRAVARELQAGRDGDHALAAPVGDQPRRVRRPGAQDLRAPAGGCSADAPRQRHRERAAVGSSTGSGLPARARRRRAARRAGRAAGRRRRANSASTMRCPPRSTQAAICAQAARLERLAARRHQQHAAGRAARRARAASASRSPARPCARRSARAARNGRSRTSLDGPTRSLYGHALVVRYHQTAPSAAARHRPPIDEDARSSCEGRPVALRQALDVGGRRVAPAHRRTAATPRSAFRGRHGFPVPRERQTSRFGVAGSSARRAGAPGWTARRGRAGSSASRSLPSRASAAAAAATSGGSVSGARSMPNSAGGGRYGSGAGSRPRGSMRARNHSA